MLRTDDHVMSVLSCMPEPVGLYRAAFDVETCSTSHPIHGRRPVVVSEPHLRLLQGRLHCATRLGHATFSIWRPSFIANGR
jgi:hypothetical protein